MLILSKSLISFVSYFSDNVKALKLVWIIGAEFLKDMDQSLTSVKLQVTQSANANPLYLCMNYNVITFFSTNLRNTNPFLARIYNSLVEGLNSSHQLPQYIMVMLDRDLIVNVDLYDYGVSRTIEDTLKWLSINLNQALEQRKLDLIQK